jgi:hypothetical protein
MSMSDEPSDGKLMNATAALMGVVVGYLAHGHWPAIESLIRLWVG